MKDNISLSRMNEDRMANQFDSRVQEWVNYYDKRQKFFGFRQRLEKVCGFIPNNTKEILDVGCGTGALFEEFISGKLSVGVDISINMLREAIKGSSTNGKYFICADALSLPFKDGIFDCVIAVGLFEYFENRDELLVSLKKTLSDKGVLIITLPNGLSPLGMIDTSLLHMVNIIKRRKKNRSQHFAFKPNDFKKFLEQNGLKVEKEDYMFCSSVFLTRLCPGASYFLDRILTRVNKRWGEGYIVKASKYED